MDYELYLYHRKYIFFLIICEMNNNKCKALIYS